MTANNLITVILSKHLGTLKINGKLILPPFEIHNSNSIKVLHILLYCDLCSNGVEFCEMSWFLDLSRWYFLTSKVAPIKNKIISKPGPREPQTTQGGMLSCFDNLEEARYLVLQLVEKNQTFMKIGGGRLFFSFYELVSAHEPSPVASPLSRPLGGPR